MEAPLAIRQLFRFTPLVIVALLFGGPLLIWLVKDDQSPVQTVRLQGTVVAQAVPQPNGRIAVRLDNGDTVAVSVEGPAPRPAGGTKVTVLRSSDRDGLVVFELERRK